MRQAQDELTVTTRGRGLHEFTDDVGAWCASTGINDGLLTLFVRHTSASLIIQENADPDVMRDLEDFFAGIAPEGDGLYRHSAEGPDDMPAHIRAALTQTQLSIPVRSARPVLGTWQGIYLFEHRTRGHSRRVALHLIGA